ncbi:hypothetical protein A9Q81_18260 [Gammaproteobacteria bacterium 42_54_T18]|nr:hypothetical protein A9Q81_18260 [Gammaproteobacteria bacterium 42_54_T18]
MIIVKLTLVPLIILGLSLAGKRWGSFVSGILSGLPVIAGPITLFLALEQGHDFATASANSTLLGIFALSSFCFIYGLCARRYGWLTSLTIGWICYFIIATLISHLSLPPQLSMLLVALFIALLLKLTPTITHNTITISITKNELIVRMLAAMLLVMVITTFANILGPTFSGIFAAFPVAASVLAVFTHSTHSGIQAALLLRGVTIGLLSLSSFYCSLILLTNTLGFYSAFLASLILVLCLQLFMYRILIERKI